MMQQRNPSNGNEKLPEITHSGQKMISSELFKSSLARFAADPLYTLGRVALA
jgi:hypothetical protein